MEEKKLFKISDIDIIKIKISKYILDSQNVANQTIM